MYTCICECPQGEPKSKPQIFVYMFAKWQGTAAAAPPPFRHGNPALCGSCPLVTPYCRLGDLLCIVFMSAYCMFDLSVYYLFLQYFDTVGWVFWPVKTVFYITMEITAPRVPSWSCTTSAFCQCCTDQNARLYQKLTPDRLMHWISGAWGRSLIYAGITNCEVRRLNQTTSPYYDHTENKTHAIWSSGQNGRVSRRQENSDCSSPEWVEKASWATLHLLNGHSEERPSSAQPYLGGCYRTGSE